MFKQLIYFVNEYGLSYKHQFGFRAYHSFNLALIYPIDKVWNALEDGDYVFCLSLDFSKAFDTVNHDILLSKLEHNDIRVYRLIGLKAIYVDGSNLLSTTVSVLTNKP